MPNYTVKDELFELPCSVYLNSLGFNIVDGQRGNAPYREDSDSESFVVNGQFFSDHSHHESGNTWDLSLKMKHGDRREALQSLAGAAGISLPNVARALTQIDRVEDAIRYFEHVKDNFSYNSDLFSDQAREYLVNRKVGEKSCHLFSFIPQKYSKQCVFTIGREYDGDLDGDQCSITTHLDLSNLHQQGDRLIYWYQRNNRPVYFGSRKLNEKEYFKGNLKDFPHLEHPLWNIQDLYEKEHVVLAEGLFDATSLMELGYGVGSSVTCATPP